MVVTKDRRIPRPVSLEKVGLSVHAQDRIEVRAKELHRANDAKWKRKDSAIWQSDYETLKHSTSLAEDLASLCEVDGSHDEAIQASVALWHDISKTKFLFAWLHRRRRRFNYIERWVMGWHAFVSAFMVRDAVHLMRREERVIGWEIFLEIAFHHKPWLIFWNKTIRMRTWKLNFADSRRAKLESRESEAMTGTEALESSITVAEGKIPRWAKKHYDHEITNVISLMRQCFGTPVSEN